MNRRSFFRYAVGGMCAAPLALVGERASAYPAPRNMGLVGEIGPGIDDKVLVEIAGAKGDAHIRALVQQGVDQAMRAYLQQPNPRRA
ncbi:hypothetical protein RMR10_004645 [Agrobacterium rosae]|uniref:hypothetical protein n=1 Tax=Agrobacterium rosae TaxID=1972867 RepID=UPI002A0E4570|nr:hypothetical protein [Agrobacterium rosae]MDX8315589.1 hypothetical protein [Agrobacterium rosae]